MDTKFNKAILRISVFYHLLCKETHKNRHPTTTENGGVSSIRTYVRKLIYIFSLLCFLPAIFLLLGGMTLIPTAVFIDLGKGHLSSLVLLLPLIGGIFGVFMAFTVAFELLGWTNTKVKKLYKYLGLLSGVTSELSIVFWITPNLEPFLTFWLPPLLATGLLLFGLYTNTTNKPIKRDC